MPRLMVMLIESNQALAEKVSNLENKSVTAEKKGVLIKGFKSLMKHFRVGDRVIRKYIDKGAPIAKVGRSFQAYDIELFNWIANNNK